jgi:hypothetical protein
VASASNNAPTVDHAAGERPRRARASRSSGTWAPACSLRRPRSRRTGSLRSLSPRRTSNGDGKIDVALGTDPDLEGVLEAGTVDVLSGKGDGTFGSKRVNKAGRSSLDVTTADVNRDGKTDLVVAVTGSSTLLTSP